jgi:hypothetical protein
MKHEVHDADLYYYNFRTAATLKRRPFFRGKKALKRRMRSIAPIFHGAA